MENADRTRGLLGWIDRRWPIISFLRGELVDYPQPRNLNYWWSFGFLSGTALLVLIVSGVFLAMHYTPHADFAFASVQRIVRDVPYGWLIRPLHAHAASLFFALVYIHTFRGLYYGSYKAPREVLWSLGVALLALMIPTAFMGYVLPWGQMSYWAATVVTSMVTAVPVVGEDVVAYIRGGYEVGNPTLARFYALHFFLPFVIAAVAAAHVWALHAQRSNNPLGIEVQDSRDVIPFHPFFTIQDMLALAGFLLVLAGFVFFAPDLLTPAENFQPADPLSTPHLIVPEWYLLPFYAMLKAIPFKILGIVAMLGAILVLFAMPWLDRSPVRSARFRPIYRVLFWILVADCVLLAYAGTQPAEGVPLLLARIGTAYYFAHFLVLVPAIAVFERPRALPQSISAAIMERRASRRRRSHA